MQGNTLDMQCSHKYSTSSFAHFTCFSYCPLICLCEQSGTRQLSVQRSDGLSPFFALTQHSKRQFSLQTRICFTGFASLTVSAHV